MKDLDPKWKTKTVIWTEIEEADHFKYDDLKDLFAAKVSAAPAAGGGASSKPVNTTKSHFENQ